MFILGFVIVSIAPPVSICGVEAGAWYVTFATSGAGAVAGAGVVAGAVVCASIIIF
jgi:hypothetical protein